MSTPSPEIQFEAVARFPDPRDNAAIALIDLTPGMQIRKGDALIELQHDVLTGHRFAAVPIAKGAEITSWHYPFGRALRAIEAGEYLCNANVLFRLSIQEKEPYTYLRYPSEPNFEDEVEPYVFDAAAWKKPAPLQLYSEVDTFMGYPRGFRGTGTRNHLVILSVSSTTAPLVERLEERHRQRAESLEHVDSIVGLRHTEGSEVDTEERDRTLRTLAGLLNNPNVGGFVAIDSGLDGELSNAELEAWMRAHDFPLNADRVRWMSASESFEQDIVNASGEVDALLAVVSQDQRTACPVSQLRIGLQCGASDAFSGVCGNVLSAAIAREVILQGGSANLTETPELSGAEDYTLISIKEPAIATRFLGMLDRFKEHLGWHGGKVDKNPSEGNLLGGLYNITLKSLGAAVKRDPGIPVEHVIEYGELMDQPGFYFMDGMGGDIASYTGQAAAGCNIVLFVTGRGTPTNSSIVPTIKIVNTTKRYQLMAGDIDINAGQYLDGQSMEDLTDESIDLVKQIASGAYTNGESRHQNIDLTWRQKYYKSAPAKSSTSELTRFAGQPLDCQPAAVGTVEFDFGRAGETLCKQRVGLVIPTVGCSIATARQAVDRLNAGELVRSGRIDRFVVLPNTEGCGVTTGSEVLNFILSYATHAYVETCLFLSLGCEMVSPSFIKSAMRGEDIGFPEITAATAKANIDPARFGWLTIQETGGTEGAAEATEAWFIERLKGASTVGEPIHSTQDLRLGLMSIGPVGEDSAAALLQVAGAILAGGGSVVIPECSELLKTKPFQLLVAGAAVAPTLAFAQNVDQPGLHVMQSITENPLETVTGLGAATDVIVNFSDLRPVPGHVLIPTLNLTQNGAGDYDHSFVAGAADTWARAVADLVVRVVSGQYQPRQNALGHVGNQIARGPRAHVV